MTVMRLHDNAADLHGKKYKRIFVCCPDWGSKPLRWMCRCDCGNYKSIASDKIVTEEIGSCGCLAADTRAIRSSTHGFSNRDMSEYNIWKSMRSRCLNPKNKSYKNYGGRGISVCARWLESFVFFLEDVGSRPKGTSLERIDNNLGYFKENCRWASSSEQSRNRRNNKLVYFGGVFVPLIEASEACGINYHTVHNRIRSGWSLDRALHTPPKKKRMVRLREAEIGGEKGATP